MMLEETILELIGAGMLKKCLRVVLVGAGILLLGTAAAKFISAAGTAAILQRNNPILNIPFRDAFWFVGLRGLLIAVDRFCDRKIGRQAGLVAWVATNFLFYQIALMWAGYQKPCTCLGNLTDVRLLKWRQLV